MLAKLIKFWSFALPVIGAVPGDVWGLFHSFTFDLSVWEIFGALLSGGSLAIFPRDVVRSAPALLCSVASAGVTILDQTPAGLYQLVAAAAEEKDPPPLAVRLVLVGGETLDTGRLAPWFSRSPGLINMYGITETTVHVTHRVLTDADFGSGDDASPIGGGSVRRTVRDVRGAPQRRPVPPRSGSSSGSGSSTSEILRLITGRPRPSASSATVEET